MRIHRPRVYICLLLRNSEINNHCLFRRQIALQNELYNARFLINKPTALAGEVFFSLSSAISASILVVANVSLSPD